jgi:hypothetical protein
MALLFALAPALSAADWPQFRGPAGTGVADDQKPPVKFGLKETWFGKFPSRQEHHRR